MSRASRYSYSSSYSSSSFQHTGGRSFRRRMARREHDHVCVIKVGSSTIIDGETGEVNIENIGRIAGTIKELQDLRWGVVLVSSGAVARGKGILCGTSISQRPNLSRGGTEQYDDEENAACGRRNRKAELFGDGPMSVSDKQALAAVGQASVIDAWREALQPHGVKVAQVLFGRADIGNRVRYANALSTIDAILGFNVVPIVNENDTVATEELGVGDNDNLSALCAAMCSASILVLLTDVDGLYTANPNTDPNAERLQIVSDITKLEVNVSSGAGSSMGTGGMATKIEAARVATAAGTPTAIFLGTEPERIVEFANASEKVTIVPPRKGGKGTTKGGVMLGIPTHDDIPTGDADGSNNNNNNDDDDGNNNSNGNNNDSHYINNSTSSDEDDDDPDPTGAWGDATSDSGTIFLPSRPAARSRKRWVLAAQSRGDVLLDRGAVAAVLAGKSLFAAGVVDAIGDWESGEVATLVSAEDGVTVGRGTMELSAEAMRSVVGMSSIQVQRCLEGDDAAFDAEVEMPVAKRDSIVPFVPRSFGDDNN